MLPRLRQLLIERVLSYFRYATDHFQNTGLNLYCSFYNSEPKVRHTFLKKRPTAFNALLSLETLVQEVLASSYEPLLEAVRVALDKRMKYSCRAVLCAVFIRDEPQIVLHNYRHLLKSKQHLPENYANSILKIAEELETQITT